MSCQISYTLEIHPLPGSGYNSQNYDPILVFPSLLCSKLWVKGLRPVLEVHSSKAYWPQTDIHPIRVYWASLWHSQRWFTWKPQGRLGLQNATNICTALMITKQGELPPCDDCWNTHNWIVTWKLTRRLTGHIGPETEMMAKSQTILLMVLVQWQHTVWASCCHAFSALQITLSIPHRKESDYLLRDHCLH